LNSVNVNEEKDIEQTSAREPLVKVDHLTVGFDAGRKGFWGQKRQVVHAVEDVSFKIYPG